MKARRSRAYPKKGGIAVFARIVTGLAPLMSEPARACEQADEALFGMRVEVLEEKKEWVRVRTHYRYEGWVEPLPRGGGDARL